MIIRFLASNVRTILFIHFFYNETNRLNHTQILMTSVRNQHFSVLWKVHYKINFEFMFTKRENTNSGSSKVIKNV